jgi:hypothetical protein
MLTLFKGLLTNEQMLIQKVKKEKKIAFSMWKQPWWNCFNIMHGAQFFLYFFFCFIDLKLYQLVWFLTIMQILCVNYMHKGQEETNVKTHYDSFGIDPMKMCFKHKTRTKVDHRI